MRNKPSFWFAVVCGALHVKRAAAHSCAFFPSPPLFHSLLHQPTKEKPSPHTQTRKRKEQEPPSCLSSPRLRVRFLAWVHACRVRESAQKEKKTTPPHFFFFLVLSHMLCAGVVEVTADVVDDVEDVEDDEQDEVPQLEQAEAQAQAEATESDAAASKQSRSEKKARKVCCCAFCAFCACCACRVCVCCVCEAVGCLFACAFVVLVCECVLSMIHWLLL